MRNIEKVKKQLICDFAQKYFNKEEIDLTEQEFKVISFNAELWAYVKSVVPDGFGDYTIFNFNGCATDKKDNSKTNIISNKVASIARDKVCAYCWGLRWEEILQQKKKDENSIESFLRDSNIMMQRVENGNNIVIHGLSDRPIGRTMLASIVMKEAIRLRVTHHIRGHTYDWVDFSKLFQAIEQDSMELADYKSCDWLVVDNIIKKSRSEKQTTLMSDLVDPFFLDRYYNRQPTILVFKFDIRDKLLNMEKAFGVGIGRIIDSRRTFKIALSENLINNYIV
jgi:DNA replication protein DnaC